MRLLVIGGSDAGIAAALRARELSPDVEITVVVADRYPNFSVCGLPFYVSGETPDWHRLAHKSLQELEDAGLKLLLEHSALAIQPSDHQVLVKDSQNLTKYLIYDKLVVATGALPVRPNIAGIDQPGVHVLHTMDDSFAVHDRVVEGGVRDAVIVGSGYIGLEMADALTHRGVHATLFGRSHAVLPTVDPAFGAVIADELRRHGVEVRDGAPVDAISADGDRLTVHNARGERASADLVLVAAGVRSNSNLAAAAGIETGAQGAIRVDRRMATNVPDIFAAGDCVETWHRITQATTYLPLGTTSHKQGRVAGENVVGGKALFAGSVGTQVVKVFDLAVARTGLREAEAIHAGFDPVTVQAETWDHNRYYPNAHRLCIRATGDRRTGRLLGAQILGPWEAEVAKRIDVYAAALFSASTVDSINDLDLSYTPPFGSPWDAVQVAAQAWTSAVGERLP